MPSVVVKNLNTDLFGTDFESLHRMTLDQARQGYVRPSWDRHRLYSPKEYEEADNELHAGLNTMRKSDTPHVPWRERIDQMMSEPVDLAEAIGRRWVAHGSNELLIGFTHSVARDLLAFGHVLDHSSQTVPHKLYRGDIEPPTARAQKSPDMPIAFSANRHVARTHASWRKTPRRGEVFTVAANTVRGIKVKDFTGFDSYMEGTGTPEDEWLVHPQSFL